MIGWSRITKRQYELLETKQRAFFASDDCKIIMFLEEPDTSFFSLMGKKRYFAKVKESCSDVLVQAGAKVI